MKLLHLTWMFVGMICTAGTAWGQNYPAKPIRVLSSGVGGSSEFVSRLFAQELTATLGQPIIVETRTGVIAAETVAKAPPDGYTQLAAGGTLWTAPLLAKTPFDPLRDFSPITLAMSAPSVLTVHPSLPVKSVKDLMALARARPGALNYASGSTGSTTHLAGELFNSLGHVKLVRIPYKGVGAAISDLMTGQVQVAFYSPGAVMPHVQSGKLRAIAVSSMQPSRLVPGFPTVAATGLPGYEVLSVDAVFAPARTPAAIVNRLNQELVRVLTRPDIKEKMFNAGGEAVGSTAEDLGARVKSESVMWEKVIKDAGIRAE